MLASDMLHFVQNQGESALSFKEAHVNTRDTRDVYGPLYGAAMLDLLGGPRVIWPSTVYADGNTTEIPIWEQDTQILPPLAVLKLAGVSPDDEIRDRDTSPFGAALLPRRSPAFPLPRFVANWWTRRASA